MTPMRVVGLLLLGGLVAAAAGMGAALLAAPSVADLPARVAALERSAHARALPLWRIAPVLREAVVATEDERFYQHDGVDLISIARAVPTTSVTGGSRRAPARSTSSSQRSSTCTGTTTHRGEKRPRSRSGFASVTGSRTSRPSTQPRRGIFRGKHRRDRSRRAGVFRADAGASTSPRRVSSPGVIQAPSLYDPLEHPLAARERQIAVFRSMVRNRYVTQEGAAAVIASPLDLRGGEPRSRPSHPSASQWGRRSTGTCWHLRRVLLAGALAAYAGARVCRPVAALAARGSPCRAGAFRRGRADRRSLGAGAVAAYCGGMPGRRT